LTNLKIVVTIPLGVFIKRDKDIKKDKQRGYSLKGLLDKAYSN
jgi:hypothetical protein